ncbi:MAG: DUF2723 domain-containing protein [Anaerolineae bacterium]
MPLRKNLVGAICAIACVAALLAIYTLTMAPTLTWRHNGADGGDLVLAVARGSIPHPPGAPTYLLLGELFIHLPWGDPAWRLNLLSVVMATGAAGLAMVATLSLLQKADDGTQPPTFAPIVLTAGLSLGLSPLLWSQALITELYAPAAFFATLVVLLTLLPSPVWLLGLVWGISLGNHLTLLCLAPLVAWKVWQGGKGRLRRLVVTCMPTLLGWGLVYGPVLLARRHTPSPWGDVNSFAGWWELVSGRLYRGYVFGLPLLDVPQRLLAWAGLLARQFTPLGAVLAGMGLVRLWQVRRSLALASALTFGMFNIYAIGYNTTDSLVYLTLVLPVAALWLGMGISQAVVWLAHQTQRSLWPRRWAWLFLLLPMFQALLFWNQMDLNKDKSAVEWAEQVLRQAPSQAILLTDQDAHTFALWYVHDVLGKRPDVKVIDIDLWGHESYRKMAMDALEAESAESGGLALEDAVLQTGCPVVRAVDLAIGEEAP